MSTHGVGGPALLVPQCAVASAAAAAAMAASRLGASPDEVAEIVASAVHSVGKWCSPAMVHSKVPVVEEERDHIDHWFSEVDEASGDVRILQSEESSCGSKPGLEGHVSSESESVELDDTGTVVASTENVGAMDSVIAATNVPSGFIMDVDSFTVMDKAVAEYSNVTAGASSVAKAPGQSPRPPEPPGSVREAWCLDRVAAGVSMCLPLEHWGPVAAVCHGAFRFGLIRPNMSSPTTGACKEIRKHAVVDKKRRGGARGRCSLHGDGHQQPQASLAPLRALCDSMDASEMSGLLQLLGHCEPVSVMAWAESMGASELKAVLLQLGHCEAHHVIAWAERVRNGASPPCS